MAGGFSGSQQQQQPPPLPQQRSILLVEMPAELLVKILSNLSFSEICHNRLVSRRFNEICASMLNGAFLKLQSHMLQRFHEIKGKMPRRESARRLELVQKVLLPYELTNDFDDYKLSTFIAWKHNYITVTLTS